MHRNPIFQSQRLKVVETYESRPVGLEPLHFGRLLSRMRGSIMGGMTTCHSTYREAQPRHLSLSPGLCMEDSRMVKTMAETKGKGKIAPRLQARRSCLLLPASSSPKFLPGRATSKEQG